MSADAWAGGELHARLRRLYEKQTVDPAGSRLYGEAMNNTQLPTFDQQDLITTCDRYDHDHSSLIDARQCWRDEQVAKASERAIDARGEASACNDNDCSCGSAANEAAEDLDYYQKLASL